MQIKIINKSSHALPNYETIASAGMDLRANISEPITLKSLERTIVKTGLFIELPIGYEAQVRPRSGLAAKKGITVLNSPGTVDADYRGEIGVILVNLSHEDFVIENGERIASKAKIQMVKTMYSTLIFDQNAKSFLKSNNTAKNIIVDQKPMLEYPSAKPKF